METRHFQGYNCDLAELQKTIEKYFIGRCYKVTNFCKDAVYLTQAFKEQLIDCAIFSKIVGSPAAFDISLGFGTKTNNIQKLPNLDNIPIQTKLLLGEPLLEKNFWNYVTTNAELRRNTYGAVRSSVAQSAPIWREREIVTEIEVVYCRYCGAKNNARMTSCSQCGAKIV